MSKYFVIFLLVSLAASLADAKPKNLCPEAKQTPKVDLRSHFGRMRDQEDIGWCYSFGSADLMQEWLKRKHKISTNVSAAGAAMLYNNILGDADRSFKSIYESHKDHPSNDKLSPHAEVNEGGEAAELLKELAEKGYCTEKEIPSDGYEMQGYQAIMHEEPRSDGGTAFISEGLGAKTLINRGIYQYSDHPSQEQLCQSIKAGTQLFPQKSLAYIAEVLKDSLKTEKDPVSTLMRESCGFHKVPNPKPKIKFVEGNDGDHGKVLQEIRGQLQKGIPVGINYHQNVFHFHEPANTYSGADAHFSVVVGMQFNCKTQKSEYIIRNSFAKEGCQMSVNEYVWNNTSGDKEVPFSCDKSGNYIIPEDRLLPALDGAVSLE